MKHRCAVGWLAAAVAASLVLPAWAQEPAGDCIPNGSQRGVLYQGLVDAIARDIEAPSKAGDHAKVLKLAAQAQDTRLCAMPSAITIAQAAAFVAVEQVCDAAQPLEQFFSAAVPGDPDYSRAERLYDQVMEAREAGLCQEVVGGVALAEPTAAAAPSHESVQAAAAEGEPDDGSLRDNYRGGELNEGRMAFDGGNYARAAELFSVVIQQAPDSFEGYARRAQANARLNRVEAAIADYAKAIDLAPSRGYLIADFARYLIGVNRVQDALALYNNYLDRYPNDVQVLRERARARLRAGLVDLALQDYGRAIELAPGNTQLLLLRAFLFHDNGRFEEAIADYTAAIRAGASGADVHYRRGIAYYALNRASEAIADLDAAIRANPSLVAAYTARGTLYQLQGSGAAAIADFSKVIELKPESANAYLDRAREHQRQLNLDAAINDYSSVLRFDPGNLEALKGRAMLYQQRGNYANALDDLTQIINRDYVDADAYARRGWLFYAWKEYGRAMEDFDKALVIDPNGTQARLGRQAVLEAVAAAEKAAAEAAKRR
ncbi:tetratricopeptide repeat protein [Emcibacter sp. SYSU 3D8]|uniref:tetratricopeptide repeat protein n=1 Tax=Emcibacter sp. SYSU 3D8 TaxID=3133969 RepID=UPI0031FF1643